MENENEFPEEEIDEKRDDSGISSDLIRGHINTIILRTLSDGDKYGYEIIDSIESKSKGSYTIKQPTLYSALKRLESQGYVTSYWGGSSGGGRRRYFSLTEEGRTFYLRNQQEWEYSRSIIDSLITETPTVAPVVTPAISPIEPVLPIEENPEAEQSIPEEETILLPVEPEEETAIEEEYDSIIPTEEEVDHPDEETDPLGILHEQAEEDEETDLPTADDADTEAEPTDEGDYKDVIGMLYTNAIDSDDVPEDDRPPITKAAPEQLTGNIEFFNILEQAEFDGIKVRTSGVYKPKDVSESEAPTAFFNKGKAMFFSALSTFAVLFIEWILTFATQSVTGITTAYSLTVLGVGIIFLAIFGIIYALGFGKNAIKHKNASYLVISVILFIIASLVITALAIGKGAKLTETKDLLSNLIFPIVYATNTIVYALIYRFFRAKM